MEHVDCVTTAVQSERDQIRVRRPAYEESRAARPDGIAVSTLHRAELLSREVVNQIRFRIHLFKRYILCFFKSTD